jgi:beta-galactosidase
VDFYGTSFYPKHSAFVDREVPWRAALLDFTRSFGYDEGRSGFWVGELQGGFGTIALNVSPTVTPDDLRVWTWTALSRGAKGINYYAWYPMSTGYESGGFGLNHLDGTVSERARLAGSIARVVDANQRLFLDSRPPRAEVAVIYNPLGHFVGGRQRATAYAGPQGEVAGIERDSLLGIHRALFTRNVPLDYVHIDHLSAQKLGHYKLVVFPYPVMVPEASAKLLREYVTTGGTLVAEARLAWNNEKGYASERIPGLGLWEVMGAREIAVQTGVNGRTELHWASDSLPGLKPGDRLRARWYEEVLEPIGSDARVVARFENGAAAAVQGTFGKGRTLLLGSYVSAAYQTSPTEAVERFYAGLLAWAGVTLPVSTTGAPFEVRYLESGADALVFIFNHGAARATGDVSLRLTDASYSARNLVTGHPLATTRGADGVRMNVTLDPKDVQVVHLAKAPAR